MLYVLIGMSILFVAIGFLVTENNARQLLAGYNTMSEAERAKIDLGTYIPYFRKFHLFLGLSFLIVGLVLYYAVSEMATGVFLAVYPIVAYMYFMWSSNRLTGGQQVRSNRVATIVLAGCLGLVAGILVTSMTESRLLVDDQGIEITGSYGEELAPAEIESVSLTGTVPGIRIKINGFAMGAIHKGYFKTTSGQTVKLILQTQDPPFLLITTKAGEKVYFSGKENAVEAAFQAIRETFPELVN